MVVVYNGIWTAERDYKVYPKDKWCDMDYVASWVQEQGYQPKTSVENLVNNIILYYESYLSDNDADFYIDNKTASENGLMVSVEDVACFVNESGGLKEFDFEH